MNQRTLWGLECLFPEDEFTIGSRRVRKDVGHYGSFDKKLFNGTERWNNTICKFCFLFLQFFTFCLFMMKNVFSVIISACFGQCADEGQVDILVLWDQKHLLIILWEQTRKIARVFILCISEGKSSREIE